MSREWALGRASAERWGLRTLAFLTPIAVAACAGPTEALEPLDGSSAGLTRSLGVIEIDADLDGGDERAVIAAAFARYRDLDERDVESLIGQTLDAARITPRGSCRLLVGSAAPIDLGDIESSVTSELELLDIGSLHVDVSVARTLETGSGVDLAARTFPDLASLMSGVRYGGILDLGATTRFVDEGGSLSFRSGGSDDLEAFVVTADHPGGLADFRLGKTDDDGSSALRWQLAPESIDRNVAALFRWSAGDPSDLVEVEIDAGGSRLVCASDDRGGLRIAADALAALPADTSASVRARRVHVEPVDIAGLDRAFVRMTAESTQNIPLR